MDKLNWMLTAHHALIHLLPRPGQPNKYKPELATGIRVVVWAIFGAAGIGAAWRLLHLPLLSLSDTADADVASRRGLFSRFFRTALALILVLLLLGTIGGLINTIVGQWEKG